MSNESFNESSRATNIFITFNKNGSVSIADNQTIQPVVEYWTPAIQPVVEYWTPAKVPTLRRSIWTLTSEEEIVFNSPRAPKKLRPRANSDLNPRAKEFLPIPIPLVW